MESYVVLARRYRPTTFSEVLGQEATARTLSHAIEAGRVAHAYLFAGPRGVGKTSMARILAKALCCLAGEGPTTTPCDECDVCRGVARGEDLDVIEIDGASNRGIDEVRAIRDNASFAPARARVKIYIIDEVHMLTEAAFNALLKILEEPPAHVKFMFATTEPHKVPSTILSRCQRFDFRRIPVRTIVHHLEKICEAEGVKVEEGVLDTLAQASAGGMRDAQSVLDQLITLGEGNVGNSDLEHLLGTVSTGRMEALFRAIIHAREAEALSIYEEIHAQGIDAAEFLSQAIETVRCMLVLLTCGRETDLLDLTQESQLSLAEAAESWGLPRVIHAMGVLADTLKDVKRVGAGRPLVELALVKLAGMEHLKSLDEILLDLRELEGKLGPGGSPAPASATAAAGRSPAPAPDMLFKGTDDIEGLLRGGGSPGLTIDGVRGAWGEILSRVKQRSSAVGSFLGSGEVLGFEDDAITVGFSPSSRFQRVQLEDPDHIRVIEAEIGEVLGATLRLKAIEAELPESDAAPAEEAPAAEDSVTRAEIERIRGESIVRTLKDLFMARLVHIERT